MSKYYFFFLAVSLLCFPACQSDNGENGQSNATSFLSDTIFPASPSFLTPKIHPDSILTIPSTLGESPKPISNTKRTTTTKMSNPSLGQPLGSIGKLSRYRPSYQDALDYLALLYGNTTTVEYLDASLGGSFTGGGGSIIKVPENAFLDGEGKAYRGRVKMVVGEYLSNSASVTQGLTTMQGGRRLETGGMLQLQAESEAGASLTLASDKAIELDIPTEDIKLGMQAFTGTRRNGMMDWLVQSAVPQNNFRFDQSEMIDLYHSNYIREPSFPGGEKALAAFLQEELEYPEDAARKGITGSCELAFDVSTEGEVSGIKVLEYNFPSFSYEAVEALKKMRFYPGYSIRGEWEGIRSKRMKFEFHPKEKLPVELNWSHQRQAFDQFKEDGLVPLAYFEGILAGAEKKLDSLRDSPYRRMRCGMGTPRRTGIIYNAISTTELGWINCDRFTAENLPLANLVLDVADPEQKAFFLILQESKSIMPGDYTCDHGQVCFPNLPIGYHFKVFGVEKGKAGPSLGELSGAVSADEVPVPIQFAQAKEGEIYRALKELDRFN